jgi:hypothetical protein
MSFLSLGSAGERADCIRASGGAPSVRLATLDGRSCGGLGRSPRDERDERDETETKTVASVDRLSDSLPNTMCCYLSRTKDVSHERS